MVAHVDEDYVNEKALSLGEGVRQIIVDPELWYGNIPAENEIQKIVDQVVRKQSAKVSNYKKWILGYGLVMTCAIFDDFLNELLREVLKINPKFTGWDNAVEILADFDKKTIDKKYKVFINKLGFTPEEFFDFSIFNSTIQHRLVGSSITTLNEIYEKRNKVAHTDGYALNAINELADISMLFEKLVWNLSLKCRRKLSIKSELVDMVVATQKKSTTQSSS